MIHFTLLIENWTVSLLFQQDVESKKKGHDIRVHREFYRLPENTLQVAKVSKLLHCINDGTISQYKGMDFSEIEFSVEGKFCLQTWQSFYDVNIVTILNTLLPNLIYLLTVH